MANGVIVTLTGIQFLLLNCKELDLIEAQNKMEFFSCHTTILLHNSEQLLLHKLMTMLHMCINPWKIEIHKESILKYKLHKADTTHSMSIKLHKEALKKEFKKYFNILNRDYSLDLFKETLVKNWVALHLLKGHYIKGIN